MNWIFTVQTERVVAKDNTVAIADRNWQLEKSRFRSSLAGCTVTIHEHLDGNVSIRYGPHVVGRYTATGETCPSSTNHKPESRGKGGPWRPWKTARRFPTVPTVPWKSRRAGIPTFPPLRSVLFLCYKTKPANPLRQAEEGSRAWQAKTGQIVCE